jgi:hypothetical protein
MNLFIEILWFLLGMIGVGYLTYALTLEKGQMKYALTWLGFT